MRGFHHEGREVRGEDSTIVELALIQTTQKADLGTKTKAILPQKNAEIAKKTVVSALFALFCG